jgi:CheY-like chemotaxis protein
MSMTRKILVLEDSPTQAERVRLLLEGEGFQVDVAPNGREGLERLAREVPDLIISDVMMPEMDGYAFCQAVKSDPKTKRIPVVLLTQQNSPEDILRGLERGADNFITKPFEDEYLLERIRGIFEHVDLGQKGYPNAELLLRSGGREIVINPDKQQILELLLSAYNEVCRLNDQLKESQRIVQEHARDLEEQTRQVQEANRLKSEFLANMSHELRTPLNAIIGFSELMHDAKVGPVSAQHKEFLGDILASARHLLQLINDVLDLAKVEAGKMEFRPEPVDLARVVTEVQDVLRTLMAKKRIHVQSEIDLTLTHIVTDPGKLKQVLYNYLSNALKFTPDEGRVTVRVMPEGSEAFRLEVEDTGIGIRREDQGRLFVEFQQLDASTAKKHPGTGLGLALTKRIVEAQGGRVGVRSTPGEGSVFFAILPRVALATPEAEATPAVPRVSRPGAPAILIIEDDARDRAWLQRTLSEAGYAAEVAATGAEGLALCRERPFEAITLDLLLPDMNGWEVLEVIRTNGPNRDVPVIVVTVVAEGAGVRSFPVHEFLAKPVQTETLLASLVRAGIAPDGSKKILVVDDDPHALKLAETILTQLGYQPICKADAERGLRAAAEEKPAAVVLDLLMPGMDGFAFLERFRRTATGRWTPVIVWTVKDLSADERKRLKTTAQAVVQKGQGGTAALLEQLKASLSAPRE